MLTALVVALRTLALCFQGHRAIALENLALRQQLASTMAPMALDPMLTADSSGPPSYEPCSSSLSCCTIVAESCMST